MGQDVGVVAPSILERVREDRHPVEGLLFVDSLGECEDIRSEPSRIDRHGAERIAEHITGQDTLHVLFFVTPSIPIGPWTMCSGGSRGIP